jgi:hypothetical protein
MPSIHGGAGDQALVKYKRDKKEVIETIRGILSGIDATEDDGGWWETSTGSEFGAKNLKRLKTLSRHSDR